MVKDDALSLFHPAVRRWFNESFNALTPPQNLGWPPIAQGENTLLLERLQTLVGRPFVRVGLSATQRPLKEVTRFLGGYGKTNSPRPVTIVDAGMRKDLDIAVLSPVADMTDLPCDDDTGPSIWPAIYERLLELIEAHRSTLIFANNRRSVERIAAELNKLAGHDLVYAHHGSVSKSDAKERRFSLEQGVGKSQRSAPTE
jgi:ATP-dependent Lhr-like helicase